MRKPPSLEPKKLPQHWLRLVGILPLLFFVAQTVHYWRINELGNLLWMCNVGNLMFAIGLFFWIRRLMLVAIIWTIPGLLIWILYVVLAWGSFFSSFLAHVGGLVVGMFVLRQIGMDRLTWLYAFAWYLAIQLLSRLITAPNLNVNLAHSIQPGWDHAFGAYWQFWIVLTLAVGFSLFGLDLALRRVWPGNDR
ncbi:MAG TPA: hypothetical protein VI306_25205 [Pyrinomonadaceae bacterium]